MILHPVAPAPDATPSEEAVAPPAAPPAPAVRGANVASLRSPFFTLPPEPKKPLRKASAPPAADAAGARRESTEPRRSRRQIHNPNLRDTAPDALYTRTCHSLGCSDRETSANLAAEAAFTAAEKGAAGKGRRWNRDPCADEALFEGGRARGSCAELVAALPSCATLKPDARPKTSASFLDRSLPRRGRPSACVSAGEEHGTPVFDRATGSHQVHVRRACARSGDAQAAALAPQSVAAVVFGPVEQGATVGAETNNSLRAAAAFQDAAGIATASPQNQQHPGRPHAPALAHLERRPRWQLDAGFHTHV